MKRYDRRHTSLTSLLQSHVALDDSWDDTPEGHIRCNWVPCDFEPIPEDDDNHWRETFAEHVADKLIEAGFIADGLGPAQLPTSR